MVIRPSRRRRRGCKDIVVCVNLEVYIDVEMMTTMMMMMMMTILMTMAWRWTLTEPNYDNLRGGLAELLREGSAREGGAAGVAMPLVDKISLRIIVVERSAGERIRRVAVDVSPRVRSGNGNRQT